MSHPHIGIHASEQAKADFSLNPGSVSERVEVSSGLPLLETQSSEVGQDLTSRQVNDLPLNGRNYTFLAQVSAGVTQMQTGRAAGTGAFTANGLPSSHNSYLLDGIDNNNNTIDFLNGNSFVVLTPPDAIQEVNVQTSNFSAELGRAGSAVINATTKSGTNQLQGALWEYLRNDALDASTWSANRSGTSKPELRQNQFGFTIGGPLVHNKTFFFGDYQGTRIAQTSLHNPTVPTAVQRNSGFTNFQDLILNQSGTRTDNLGRIFPNGAILDPATTRPVTAGQIDPITGLVAKSSGYSRDPFFGGNVAGVTNFTTAANRSLLNILPANRLDPNAIKLLSAYPAPNTAGFSGGLNNNYVILRPLPNNTNQFDTRVDHNFSEKDQIFARVGYAARNQNAPADFTGAIDNSGFGQGSFKDRAVNAALSETHLFSPTTINEVRVGYSLLTDNIAISVANQTGIPQQFGIQGAPQGTGLGGLPNINIPGLTSVGPGGFAAPNTRTSDTRQITENLTKIRGPHTFKGGFQGQWLRYAYDNPRAALGAFNFDSSFTGIPGGGGLGAGMATLLLTPIPATVPNGVNYDGGPGSLIADSNVAPDNIRHYYGLYVQDDWKVTPKLTLNLGIRWEYFSLPMNRYGAEANFESGPPGAGAAYVINSRSKDVALSPAFISQLAKDGIALQYRSTPGLIPAPKDNFAPRIGFAYQPTSKLVIRSSYGIFFAGFENLGSVDMGYNYPFAVEPSLNDGTNGTLPLWQQYPAAFTNGQISTLETGLQAVNPNPTSAAFNPQGLSLKGFAKPWHTGYTQEWNFTVQYALTKNDSVQAAYIGNHSLHMLNDYRSNAVSVILPPGTNVKKYVPFPDFASNVDYPAANGDAYYHGFQLTYQRRFAQGLGLLANYTRSRCMIDFRNILSDDIPATIGRGLYLPGWGVKGNYQLCNDDSPNVFHLSGTWQIPYGRGLRYGGNTNRIADAFLGGWSVNGILTAQNGFPGTVGCITATSNFGCVANVVPGQPLYPNSGPHGIKQFLSPKAFAQPSAATAVGQTDYSPLGGRGQQFHGPSFNNLDFSIFKRFPVTEQVYFQLRGEAFNVSNHPNFANSFVTLDFTNSNFGQINNTTGNARQIQLALKLYW